MIRRKRADSYVYRLYCDLCGAEMRASNVAMVSNPQQIPHDCSNPDCSHKETIRGVKYPLIDTIEINEEAMSVPNSPTPVPDKPAA